MKVLALVALAACAKHAETPPQGGPSPQPWSVPAASPLAGAHQLVTAVTDNWSSTTATVTLWQLDMSGWLPSGPSWPAVIGKTGAAWGDGLHGTGAPAGRSGPVKQEGDLKSPAGAFALASAFGYSDVKTRLPYQTSGSDSVCVDDPASRHYGEVGDVPDHDWKSAEKMHRDDGLYELGIVVAHNATHVARRGSCIFLHVWAGPGSTTVGCTAMAKPELAKLVSTLDSHARFVLLPRDEYRALSEPWGLPAQ